jgi:polyphosphate kinase
MAKRKTKSEKNGSEKAERSRARSRSKPEDSMPDELQEEFFNREIEWLEFNNRVLHEALDPRTPLLERVRFLGICTSNLDEFFMKRVGGLKGQVAAGVQRKAGGLNALQSLAAIRAKVKLMCEAQASCYKKQLLPELVAQGIHLLNWKDLNPKEQAFATQYFKANVFPVLTPLAVDPGLPFPFLSNLSTSLGITLRNPDRDEKLFARIKVPKIFPQWIQVRGDELPTKDSTVSTFRFVSLIEVIQNNLKGLFPDMEVIDVMPFRITRNADVERIEDDAEDLLEMVAEEVKQRRFAEVVRLEHGPKVDSWMLNFLMEELELTETEVYEYSGFLDFTDLKPIADLNIPRLRYEPWTPVVPTTLQEEGMNLFSLIKNADFLVHHPYESFNLTVDRFIQSAAEDPKVLAIKMTLYRTGDDSPFIPSLIRAAEAGKQVACLIELKARFDEERNIHWAQALEDAGVHVVYGVVGLKTHAKTALIVRQENEGLQCYAHIGTGNYHKDTAKLYTDVGLFTCKPDFTEDVVELFHFLTGRSLKRNYKKLLVAPIAMKDRFLEMIRRETENAKLGRPARIIAKCNSLEDVAISRALYEASKAGVKVDLIIRGFCCLRPKVVGLSENIRVISIIGRFLEHSRIFYFQNGNSEPLEGQFFIGSADWMHRNLHARIEACVPIEDLQLRQRLWEILNLMLTDRRQAWELQTDGSYIQYKPNSATEEWGTQRRLMELTKSRNSVSSQDVPIPLKVSRS